MPAHSHGAHSDLRRLRLTIGGAVQGVGFRPFVYRLATRLGLAGLAANTGDGVVVEIEGSVDAVEAFADALRDGAPAQAEIRSIVRQVLAPLGEQDFLIRESDVAPARATIMLPDLATCDACLAECFDPANRRHLYPFTNCTDCGPRYSILNDLPYDRARTTMASFPMCGACAAEYADPADRRFHAEPVACPTCGPRLSLWDKDGHPTAERGEAMAQAAVLLRAGRVVAIKGLGGFHLFADARNEEAVRRLRTRKRRPTKPFALMVPSPGAARALCFVDAEEERLLSSSAAPIVLLRRRPDAEIARSVAPRQGELGVMLPYTPLHHILMRALSFPVVATSGNFSEEPIVTDERDAVRRLSGIADAFLVHDRAIARPLEDSVTRVILGQPQAIRRARGLAPLSLALHPSVAGEGPTVLALGGHLKAAATLLRGADAVVGAHVGDLGSMEAEAIFTASSEELEALHGTRADVIACDLHPDYATTHLAERSGRRMVQVPHHLAHIVSIMAEHGLGGPLIGIAWDGTGYGPDGTVWGGEFLHVERGSWRRVAHLRTFRLPGADAAAREPRRSALGALYEALGPAAFERLELAPVSAFGEGERTVLRRMLERGLRSPWTSSAGRLFDAFAALLGLTQVASHEGEAAMRLEALADGKAGAPYPFEIAAPHDAPLILDWVPMVLAVLEDLAKEVSRQEIAGRIHASFAAMMDAVVSRVGLGDAALAGGCFQNGLLTEEAARRIEAAGARVFLARAVPPNDGGLSLGQALWARWTASRE